MDGKTILTVFVTLAGAAIIQWLTYIFQGKAAERQRNWALEDEKRNHEKELEIEQRRLKRELLIRRLAIVEEILSLQVRVLGEAIDEAVGSGSNLSSGDLGVAIKRIDEINSDAFAAVLITGSEELKEKYTSVSYKYWNFIRENEIDPSDWSVIREAQIAVMKIIDDMRTVV
ncbi:MAG: hypothetical protein HYY41_00915 [Chloroflexi bacterium]|nr:hypothetical protein [Chloroflexota bacterium]